MSDRPERLSSFEGLSSSEMLSLFDQAMMEIVLRKCMLRKN